MNMACTFKDLRFYREASKGDLDVWTHLNRKNWQLFLDTFHHHFSCHKIETHIRTYQVPAGGSEGVFQICHYGGVHPVLKIINNKSIFKKAIQICHYGGVHPIITLGAKVHHDHLQEGRLLDR